MTLGEINLIKAKQPSTVILSNLLGAVLDVNVTFYNHLFVISGKFIFRETVQYYERQIYRHIP